MVYESPFGKHFPPCSVPVHEIVLAKIDEMIKTEPDRPVFVSLIFFSNTFLLDFVVLC